jgi:hypothetical protein
LTVDFADSNTWWVPFSLPVRSLLTGSECPISTVGEAMSRTLATGGQLTVGGVRVGRSRTRIMDFLDASRGRSLSEWFRTFEGRVQSIPSSKLLADQLSFGYSNKVKRN